MKKLFLVFLIFPLSVFAQTNFNIKNASKNFDVKVEVEKCEGGFCEGKAKFSFYRKKASKSFQIINLANTDIWLDKEGQAQSNLTLRYDEQSVINFDDFNFDGFEDIAICDGKNGGYGMPSYQVYLFSNQQNKFAHSKSFTKLGQGYLGMFEINKKKKMLYTFSKSGCCWHQTEGFKVVNNRPKKVYELTRDTFTDFRITTRKFIKGKWRTWVKREDN